MNYLLYVLINFRTQYYLSMFKTFLKSLTLYSDLKQLDFLVICDKNTKQKVKTMKDLNKFNKVYYHIVPDEPDLQHALTRKFDIADFSGFMNYKKILYLDIDIIVQGNIIDVIESVPVRANTLYATKEGDIEGRYWYLDMYKQSNIKSMRDNNINSFNSGFYMFKPNQKMKKHLENVKKIAVNYSGQQHFYDQSFFNYYFNIHRLANTDYMSDVYIMFPDSTKYYPEKVILHFSGIGMYKEKSAIMKKYLQLVKKHKKLVQL